MVGRGTGLAGAGVAGDVRNLTPNPFPSGKGDRIVGSNLFPSGKGDRIACSQWEGETDYVFPGGMGDEIVGSRGRKGGGILNRARGAL
jgi:hypothetical protein